MNPKWPKMVIKCVYSPYFALFWCFSPISAYFSNAGRMQGVPVTLPHHGASDAANQALCWGWNRAQRANTVKYGQKHVNMVIGRVFQPFGTISKSFGTKNFFSIFWPPDPRNWPCWCRRSMLPEASAGHPGPQICPERKETTIDCLFVRFDGGWKHIGPIWAHGEVISTYLGVQFPFLRKKPNKILKTGHLHAKLEQNRPKSQQRQPSGTKQKVLLQEGPMGMKIKA